MEFRIGVHLGEVRVEGERLYGDGVNIAARLEGLAEPGGVCISGTVVEQIRRKLQLDFDDLGEQTVKNIPDPVHAYLLRERAAEAPAQPVRRPVARWAAAAATIIAAGVLALVVQRIWSPSPPEPELIAEADPDTPPLTAIAVLPFDDMSPGGDQKWLGDGMAEDLIESLSRIDELRVIARTSAFGHRGEDNAIIGERLQVGSVVEGSLRRSGDQLRVTAQLIRVADSSHLWSGTYARQLDDVFAIQREIAREVAEAIRTELGVSDTVSWLIESRYATPDVRAWELVKKASDRQLTLTEEGFRDEIDLTLQALEIDPEYAEAHALHGWGYWFLYTFGYDSSFDNSSKARAAAERALERDPTNGSAHTLLGWLSLGDCDWERAEVRLVRALKARPRHGGLRQGYGLVLLYTGRIEEAATHLQSAVRLDPELAFFRRSLGHLYLVRGDYEAAIDQYQRAVDLAFSDALWPLAYAHHVNGDDGRAAETIIQAAPSLEVAAAWRRAAGEDGYSGMVRAALDYQISQTSRPCTNNPETAAEMLAVIGEPDRMFACLEEGVRLKSPTFGANVYPTFDPYRDDPRFTALLRRMNLVE
jgi:TolB-like protein/cytochrome c-type biogenesis protein CcmH/NrfG